MASNTAYIGNDLGNMAGPLVAGYVIEAFGYRLMWRIMIIPMVVAFVLLIVFKGRINIIEKNFRNQ